MGSETYKLEKIFVNFFIFIKKLFYQIVGRDFFLLLKNQNRELFYKTPGDARNLLLDLAETGERKLLC
jgi:hypothetical protein